MLLNTQNTILKILLENPPLFSSDIYKLYTERAGAVSITQSGFRKHLDAMVTNGTIKKGDQFFQRKGYLYTSANKPTPVAGDSHDSVIFGDQTAPAIELIKFLYSLNEHPILQSRLWDEFRLNTILLMLGATNEANFKATLVALRERMTRTLGQLNTIIDGDLWSENKQELITKGIPNSDAVILIIKQFLNGEISELPEW